MAKLDDTDLQILCMLQENARITMREMAKQLGLSTTPVFERIKRLEKEGVIKRYVALLDPKSIDRDLLAFVQVSLKEHSKKAVEEFIRLVIDFDEVMECYHLTGDSDFMLKVVARDMEAYNEFILNKMSVIPNLGRVRSQFALSTQKKTTAYTIAGDLER
jgi:DNA-binding Lrp family transcriptional regulator